MMWTVFTGKRVLNGPFRVLWGFALHVHKDTPTFGRRFYANVYTDNFSDNF